MDVWNLVAERKIREAMEEGAFEGLEGRGRPLDLRENPFEDPSERMAHRLLKNNGFAPEWILEAREIDAELRALARCDATERRRRAALLNRRIAVYNLKVPVASAQKRTVDL